ncbi:hypothetical protein BCR44DRAFT_30129 [Catenaria anguillulae PL171]|uniref:PB1 domain-containing protein n=1 Tax=Catenaria anguillulae PL171 TaxID=765915 RepID=A0A1Y2HLW7_9FUNG|nr:hypothetical protein BCR44DRAFT_30129 [Catenaria anguillulae PL171]
MQSSSGSASGAGAGAGAGSRIIIKATLGHTTKRLALHTPSLSLPDLCSALHALFRPSALLSASTTNLILRYVDADGDHVTIDSDTDLSLALDLAANPHSSTAHLRLLVNDKLNCPLPATLSNEIDAKGLSLAGRNVASLHASLLDVRSLLDKVLDALEKARDKDRNVKPLDSDDIANLLGKSSISEGATSPIVTGAATPTPQSPAQRPASTSVTAAAAYPPQVQQQQQQQQQQAAATSNSNAYPGYPPTTAALAAAPPTATTATSAPPTASSTYPPTATATAQPQPQPQPQQPQYTGQQQQQYMGQQPPAQQQYGHFNSSSFHIWQSIHDIYICMETRMKCNAMLHYRTLYGIFSLKLAKSGTPVSPNPRIHCDTMRISASTCATKCCNCTCGGCGFDTISIVCVSAHAGSGRAAERSSVEFGGGLAGI